MTMQHTPFKRAMIMMSAISAALAAGMSATAALASVGEYQSRGKGRGGHSGKGRGNNCTNWLARLKGKTNGPRECQRRMRQRVNAGLRCAVNTYDRNAA